MALCLGMSILLIRACLPITTSAGYFFQISKYPIMHTHTHSVTHYNTEVELYFRKNSFNVFFKQILQNQNKYYSLQ